MDDLPQIKMVIIGDGAVGKTCLLVTYTRGEFPKGYLPTVFDNFQHEATLEMDDGTKHTVNIDLWDTAGQEEFDKLRLLSYRETDIFLLCFDVVNPASFRNIQSKWLPEIRHHEPNAIFLLVGLKTDLRNDQKEIDRLAKLKKKPVDVKEIETFASECGAIGYIEASSLKLIRVHDVFETVLKHFLQEDKNATEVVDQSSPPGCCVML